MDIFALNTQFTRTTVHVPVFDSHDYDLECGHFDFIIYSQPAKANPRHVAYFITFNSAYSAPIIDPPVWRIGMAGSLKEVIEFMGKNVACRMWDMFDYIYAAPRVAAQKRVRLTHRRLIRAFRQFGGSLEEARNTLEGSRKPSCDAKAKGRRTPAVLHYISEEIARRAVEAAVPLTRLENEAELEDELPF